ncbi:Transposon Tf2-8 polyprotein [Vitis vinifera]|uniref:RNA-directed DNA polymerase n=1 Tax=Vitis vinifera TaxID=29760 RepID=A0A438EMA2_VITVI|nr:Transposon Tf2-8 polyprotein [Vitis vinifera]
MKDEQLQRQRRTQPNTPQIQRNTQQNSKGPLTTKRLSWEEIRKKRSLGLCFSCDERYTPGHKCRQPQLLLMEGESGWESSEMEEPLVEQEPEISLYALAGWSESRTMRIYAQIGQHQLVALIDSGSTHNFISEKMATMLQLPVGPTRPFPVRVANGTPMQCRWKYETVRWFAIGEISPWNLSGGAKIVCCRDSGQHPSNLRGQSTPVQQELKELIEAFDDIFQAPSQLPPQRDIEHQITLKEGTDPINVRPYRYAYFQKDEIERQKDGSWRFCTDYRALNAATIKDRFPIPTVEDMLDELHGAAYLLNSISLPVTINSSWQEHLQHVKTIFKLLRQHQLFVKFKKCEFGKHELEYLGHIISADGVKVDQSKIQAMLDWPRPTTVTELRAFLGLTGYYRKFVHNYGIIARALTNLLKKGKFQWDEAAKKAFENLKAAMTTTPTLALPDFSSPFVIQTDASGDGIGAVLSQNGRPIAFMSRALGVSKQSLSTYAREMLAIIVAIQTWRPYLLGRRFTIQTDQRSLKYLLEQRILTPEQQKWMSKLVGYDYEIVYKPGKTNQAADALSRNMTSPCLNVFFVPQVQVWDEIRREANSNPYMQRIGQLATKQPRQPYQWRNGLVCYNNRIVVPPGSPLIHRLLREFHDTPMGGHSGILRTYKRLSQQFYWPSMRRSVHQYVAACDVCQKAKAETMSPAGLLQPLPIPCQVWDDITMDFIDGLPRSDGKTSIMVVVDRLSKSAHFIAIAHPYTAKTLANKFVEGVVKLHGMPRSIISDRDPVFISNFWQEFLKLSGTKLRMTSAYHPQSDGQTEVVNRCIEQYLRCFVHHKPRHWNSLLPWAEYWYNTTYHSSTGMTPFQALYGRPPPAIPSYEIGSCPIEELDDQMTARDELLQELKAHLHAANNRMKQAADKKRREVNFEVGDWVYLRLQPYRQQSVFRRTSHKLSNRYYGPYQIEERIGPVAYKLKLSPGSRIHPVFHVSLLKKKIGEVAIANDELPPLTEEGVIRLQPRKVLSTRWVNKGSTSASESLVLWEGLPEEEATWEDSQQLLRSFPNLNLEDKVLIERGVLMRVKLAQEVPDQGGKGIQIQNMLHRLRTSLPTSQNWMAHHIPGMVSRVAGSRRTSAVCLVLVVCKAYVGTALLDLFVVVCMSFFELGNWLLMGWIQAVLGARKWWIWETAR